MNWFDNIDKNWNTLMRSFLKLLNLLICWGNLILKDSNWIENPLEWSYGDISRQSKHFYHIWKKNGWTLIWPLLHAYNSLIDSEINTRKKMNYYQLLLSHFLGSIPNKNSALGIQSLCLLVLYLCVYFFPDYLYCLGITLFCDL